MAEKANRHYISTKVNPIFENMLVDLLVVKPEDVVSYILNIILDRIYVNVD
jgi:hypothetical protein